MLTAAKRKFVGLTNWGAVKAELPDELHRIPNCLKGTYSFATDGGAVGDITFKDAATGLAVKIPSGAVVRNVTVYVETAATSGGAATLAVKLESAADLLAATAVASFTLGAKLQGIPDFATVADYVVTTAERTLTLTVAAAALTAGKIHVYVDYVF